MLKTYLTSLLIFTCLYLYSQTYSYTNYSIKEGLAGSNVYAAMQDKEGFMWFATETGVSRFDGVHFKNFTIDDGLPDNEILNLFCDSKGRLWMMPFRKTICYYYKGKLYTQENDSLLRKIKITGNIFGMAEDDEGNLALAESYAIHFIKGIDAKTTRSDSIQFYILAVGTTDRSSITLFTSHGFFSLGSAGFISKQKLPNKYSNKYDLGQLFIGRSFYIEESDRSISLHFFNNNPTLQLGKSPQHLNFAILNKGFFSDNTRDGSILYNINDPSYKEHHLPGKTIANVYRDNENNLWFCTQREGIYKLNSPFVSSSIFKDQKGKIFGVHSVLKHKNSLWVGSEEGHLFSTLPATKKIEIETPTVTLGQIKVLMETKNKELLIATQSHIYLNSDKVKPDGSIKDVKPARGDSILVSTSSGTFFVSSVGLSTENIDTSTSIWLGRSTTAHYLNDTFYIGTLDGLYKVSYRDGKQVFAGHDDLLLKSRIAAIRETEDGTLWIATYDKGIVAYKNKKVVANISKNNGLSSNICRALFLKANTLWVGTDNGLNKINIDDPDLTVTRYSTADGLLSNFINAVCVDDSLVYVGTPEGVSYFDDKKISQNAPCILRLTDILISGNSIPVDTPSINLSRRDNNIRFQYAGISYRSGGNITYRYRLLGLDTGWLTTKDNFLNYPSLAAKDYTMELQAINKFGVESEIIRIPFSIEKYWWENTWIQVLGIILILFVAGYLMNNRIKQIRYREKEKNLLREQVSTLEQMALKAQMNPHFIFNSLNSIQHYVLDKDIVGANKYIAGFSRLIRLTLDNSSKHEIPISEELEYIKQYLELEQARSGDKFSYSINVSENILNESHTISPMILQPFVENSIRHGIKYRKDSQGHIKIDIQKNERGLQYVIEDNGVGRLVSGQHKGINPVQYQSKGISLTEQRIDLMNKKRKEKIKIFIIDLEENGAASGTRVLIYYPYTNNQL